MVRIEVIADDIKLTAIRRPDGPWALHIQDTSGLGDGCKQTSVNVPNDTAMGAIMSLVCGENEENPTLNAANYEIADPLLEDLPINLRPIP